MSFTQDDLDVARSEGYNQAVKDIENRFRQAIDAFARERSQLHDLLRNPEKLVVAAHEDPDLSAAMTTAVVALLLEGQEPVESR